MKSKMSAHEFEIMYDKYKNLLYRIAFTYLKGNQDIEDVLQEVFIKRMYHAPKFQSEEHEKRSIFLFYFFNQRIKCFYYVIISAFIHVKFPIMYRIICFFFDFCRKYNKKSFCIIKIIRCTVTG